MEVVILAGGLGTRLRSAIGSEIPKCMAVVSGKPFLWYLLMYLTRFNIRKVILSVGHLRGVIFKWVNETKGDFPFEIDYAIEETLLGTGGAIKFAMKNTIGDDVVVLNGDTFFDIDLNDFFYEHYAKKAAISLALKPMKMFDRYGTVIKNENNLVSSFLEKQFCADGNINGGIYLINKNFIKWPEKERFSFEKDVLESTICEKKIYAFDFSNYFIDIGIPSDYEKANNDFKVLFK